LEFSYDYQGRRIQKKVSTWNGSAYVLASTLNCVYDGWNKVAELDGSGNLVQSYLWGLDLSGTIAGAGGVGGLLAMFNVADANSHFYVMDGNGNVAGLVNGATGQVSAEYEYSPFGETLRVSGPVAEINPFRFSTKYTDQETGLVYYGYRYLNPGTGRWLSRDPIGERGSMLLYGFVTNNPINLFDKHGDVISDWAGRVLLLRYLNGEGGAFLVYNDPAWTEYMTANNQYTEVFRTEVRNTLRNYAIKEICGKYSVGTTIKVNIPSFHADLANGEAAIGYYFLNGSNSDVGDFQIKGKAKILNKAESQCCRVEFDLNFRWNDIMDPNPQYDSDTIKSIFGDIITLGKAQPYIARIQWHATSILDLRGNGDDRSAGWPFK
jgi:RHS repeat-associated protein